MGASSSTALSSAQGLAGTLGRFGAFGRGRLGAVRGQRLSGAFRGGRSAGYADVQPQEGVQEGVPEAAGG
eukprot:8064861-Alexandrium_andersonii.AAC.1